MLRPVRGTKDIYFEEAEKFSFIRDTVTSVAKNKGNLEVITPIIEHLDVFKPLGEGSDIVNKEMYTFKSRSGEDLVLRPEGTAAVVRMLLSNGIYQKLPLKLFYFGAMFRYERPQKGRQRQFYQLGVEWFGDSFPELMGCCGAEVSLIALAYEMLYALGICDFNLEINYLGTQEEQQLYSKKLVDYLSSYVNKLSEDSQRRFHSNPLRILDSKDEEDKIILKKAPKIIDYLGQDSQNKLQSIEKDLALSKLSYKLNHKLVRGLDYYTGLVFEFSSNNLGSQSTILAGGRYDGLVERMGGPSVPAVGFAAGVERLMMLLPADYKPKPSHKLAIIYLNDDYKSLAIDLLNKVKVLNTKTEICDLFTVNQGKNFSKKLQIAVKAGATVAWIIGENEVKNGVVLIKHLKSAKQVTKAIEELELNLKEIIDWGIL